MATAGKEPVPKARPGRESTDQFDPVQQVLRTRAGFLVRRLNQIHYALFAEECKTHNMTPVQFGILTALSLNPWLDQRSIGMELGLDRTATADVLARLEEKNLITRRTSPTDRRSRQSMITEEGFRALKSLHEGMSNAQRRLLAPLTPRNREIFLKLLTTLVDGNNEYSRAPTRSSL